MITCGDDGDEAKRRYGVDDDDTLHDWFMTLMMLS